jgi:serine protease Do
MVALVSASAAGAQGLEADKLFEKVTAGVWAVQTFDEAKKPLMQGSAVVIGAGTLITNCHVLAKAKSFAVKRNNSAATATFMATLQHADVERDLCQIQVGNFTAPAVELEAGSRLRIGQKVYAIGHPSGFQATLSDGLISGLRHAADEKTIELVQTTAPLSPGSSGGGLFNAQGRLVGIVAHAGKDSPGVNAAIPADWISEVPGRSDAVLLVRKSQVAPVATARAKPPLRKGDYYVGQKWTYAVVERMTGSRRTVELRVDRFTGDQVVFNGGSRTENLDGQSVQSKFSPLSHMDALNAIGGWVDSALAAGNARPLSTVKVNARVSLTGLEGRLVGNSQVSTPAGEFEVQEFAYEGYRQIEPEPGFGSSVSLLRYKATIWFAPKINRIVKFSAQTLGGTGARVDEEVILQSYDRGTEAL